MIKNYMSWVGGVDLVGLVNGAEQPNIIVHVAESVTTPLGSAPAGMILIQLDPSAPPEIMGFISPDAEVGAYFGPQIFAGTPFENAPVLPAEITIVHNGDSVRAQIKVGGKEIVCVLSGLEDLEKIDRSPAPMTPFSQQGIESKAGVASLTIDGQDIDLTVPTVGITGGPGAVVSPAGIYCR